jgi:hypothetical protein
MKAAVYKKFIYTDIRIKQEHVQGGAEPTDTFQKELVPYDRG